MIDNLVDNALTATPAGGHIRLAAHRSAHRTTVTVADDGPGMSDSAKAEAFHRFRTGTLGGTGLGLAIVHRLITEGTLEERIAEMVEAKRGLAESIVGSGETWISELSNDELADLVRLGSR